MNWTVSTPTLLLRAALALLFLGALPGCPAGAPSYGPPTESRVERSILAPPILALLGERERLGLTSAQVGALDSIHREWSAVDGRLAGRGTSVSAGMGGVTTSPGRTAPSGPEARANHLRAARAVEAVLDPEQRRAVCDLHRRRREGVHRIWPWCVE